VRLRVDQEEAKGKVEEAYRRAGLQTPTPDALAGELGIDPRALRQTLGLLLGERRLAKVTDEILMHEEHLAALRDKLTGYLREHGKLGMPEFKDLTGVSRKYSVPLLEYFDRTGLTVRVGDHRVLRKSG